jgi:hypothetical protein
MMFLVILGVVMLLVGQNELQQEENQQRNKR